jgi:hypothetical protein
LWSWSQWNRISIALVHVGCIFLFVTPSTVVLSV